MKINHFQRDHLLKILSLLKISIRGPLLSKGETRMCGPCIAYWCIQKLVD